MIEAPEDSLYGVRLDVSHTPGVLPWQSMRRLTKAPYLFHDLTPPEMSPLGEQYAPTKQETPGDVPKREVEKIVDAVSVNDIYEVLIKWKDMVEPTNETHETAKEACTTPEMREQLRRAIEIADLKAGPTLNEPEEGPPSDNGEMFTVGCVNRIAEQVSFSRYYGMMLKALAWFID